MSTEFIIGTIIGLIGIIPVIIQGVKWVKKPKLNELMKRLVDKSLSTKAHRKILKRMNRTLLRSGKRISSEYINSFVLENRGKEAVFTDLCLKHDWEPTKELCEMFMNGDYPSMSIKRKTNQLQRMPRKQMQSQHSQRARRLYICRDFWKNISLSALIG